MPKYEMLCENCGIVEIEHSMREDHPEFHDCGGHMRRYFGNLADQPIHFSQEGGGVDGWSRQRVEIQHPTSEEAGIPYH